MLCPAVLKGLTLVLPRGTTTAVVGRSGAGKSTVAALLSRFYSPDSGGVVPADTRLDSVITKLQSCFNDDTS